jgi:hypothetical protein
MADGGNKADVAKEDRKRRVIAFLVDSGMALPRKALFRNLKFQGADFSDSSLKNYLGELREESLVERVDAKAFAEGRVTPSDDDPGYWIATGDGVERIQEYRAEQENDIDTSHL